MFGRGLRVSVDPGEVTIQGSPLLEKIVSESKEIHIKQERQGFITYSDWMRRESRLPA